ncbi:hypothetical protein N311_02438, partial [Apaloderma vittatum]
VEPLLGELEELSLSSSTGSSPSRSCLMLSSSDVELGVSGVASEEETAMPEAFGDKALETDGLAQGLDAVGEDVICDASPEPVFSVEFDAECEKEWLLKASCCGKLGGAGKQRGAS